MILSMTSYGERLKTLHERIKWINFLNIPFKLYLSKNENVPDELIYLTKKCSNFEIKLCDDIKSLKKSYYVLQEYPNEDIFLLDDDWLYTPNWLMYSIDNYINHKQFFNNCVVGIIGYKVIKNNSGEFEYMIYGNAQNEFQKSLNYISGHCQPLNPTFRNVVLSGGPGSWLKRNQIHPDYFNIDLYNKLCGGTHDEIWNWIQSIRLGYKHVSLNTTNCIPINVDDKLGRKLGEINDCQTSNKYLKNLLDYYPEVRRLLELN